MVLGRLGALLAAELLAFLLEGGIGAMTSLMLTVHNLPPPTDIAIELPDSRNPGGRHEFCISRPWAIRPERSNKEIEMANFENRDNESANRNDKSTSGRQGQQGQGQGKQGQGQQGRQGQGQHGKQGQNEPGQDSGIGREGKGRSGNVGEESGSKGSGTGSKGQGSTGSGGSSSENDESEDSE
jgi:hypothetical protein